MLLTHLFENKHMTEADIASVNWNTDSKQDRLNEFAPGAGDDDEAGDDPYKYPKPERYRCSSDYFGQFEADHFDREDFDDATGVFKGYWGDKQIAYFKFDNPARTSSDDSGRGWYYEPQSDGNSDDTSAEPAVDNADERKQQELSMIRAFLKSGNRPSPGSQIYNLMKRHGVTEGQDNPYGYRKGQTVKLDNGMQGRVIDIFDDSIEVLLVGGRTVTVDFRDAQVISEQGVAEKLGDLRPKLGSSRDRGKSVRRWRQDRGLDESGMAEGATDQYKAAFQAIQKLQSFAQDNPDFDLSQLDNLPSRGNPVRPMFVNADHAIDSIIQAYITRKEPGNAEFLKQLKNEINYFLSDRTASSDPTTLGDLLQGKLGKINFQQGVAEGLAQDEAEEEYGGWRAELVNEINYNTFEVRVENVRARESANFIIRPVDMVSYGPTLAIETMDVHDLQTGQTESWTNDDPAPQGPIAFAISALFYDDKQLQKKLNKIIDTHNKTGQDMMPGLDQRRSIGQEVDSDSYIDSGEKTQAAMAKMKQGMAEASNELAAMTTMGMGNPLDFSSDYALYTVQKGRELFGTMRNLYAKANALPPAERNRFYQRLDSLAYEGLGDEILRYSKTLTVDDLIAITDVLENYDIMFNTIAIPDELQDAEAAWKQYAAEVALARTQAQPGQTMHERSMAGDSENAFAPVKLHDQQSNAYGNAILDIADQFEDKFADEKASEYATAIATVGHAFLNNGMRSGRARLFGLEQAVYKHVLMALDQQGLNIVKDLIRPHFNPDGRIPFNKMAEGDISQLEKDVADAPVEPIANMEAKEKVGNMDADAFDAAMARLKKLAGAGPLKTVWDPARRVYKNVPTAVQPKK
jgi:hypothetical protein